MYSGNDSTESQSYTQWALNPSTYNNVSSDQVDWAALAQQWIIMKEAGPPIPDPVPNVPPPPNISKIKKDQLNEGGEAPMDVENDNDKDDDDASWNNDNTPSWNWQQQQQQSSQTGQQNWQSWNNSWPVPAGVPPPNALKAPLLPTPPFNQFPANENEVVPFPNYASPTSSDYSSGYWTAAGSSKIIKPHNKRYSKVNVPVPVPPKQASVVLDAAKRKQLPAWIREGLEKMEKEKQKQMDKEREKQVKQEYEERLKLSEKEAMDIIKSTVKERSKFESDDENSNDTDGRPLTPEAASTQMTQEELMLKVRRTMTEILLKVTNKEIYNVCTEELQRHIKKLKASDHRVSAPSGANISAQLGLGVYGGSGSSDEDDSGGEDTRRDQHDSETELKDVIRRRKAEFSKTEREIEERLAEADGKEFSRATTPDSDDKDSQVDKSQGYKRRNMHDNTPPPKNQNRSKKSNKKSSTSSSDSSDESDKDKKRSRKSRRSSSKSTDSYDKSRYSRSDSRCRTPELKKSKYNSKSRRSRSKSLSKRRRRSRSSSRNNKSDSHRNSRRKRSKSSRSRSRSRSSYKSRRSRSSSRHRHYYRPHHRSRSTSKSRRSTSKSRRSTSKSRRSTSKLRRSTSKSRRSISKLRRSTSKLRRSTSKSRRSTSKSRRSTSYDSRKSRRSRSRSNRSNRRRRSRSNSSRGKRSHRH